MTQSIQVSGQFVSLDGKLHIDGAKPGTWRVIKAGTATMYLHNRLSIEVATALSLWEDITSQSTETIKITRDENHDVVGVAIRR